MADADTFQYSGVGSPTENVIYLIDGLALVDGTPSPHSDVNLEVADLESYAPSNWCRFGPAADPDCPPEYTYVGRQEPGHANHVAGILGSKINNAGVRGIAPGIKIINVIKGTYADEITSALDWVKADAIAKGIYAVANISSASDRWRWAHPELLFLWVESLSERVLVVQAAGNDGANACAYAYSADGTSGDPADGILVVGAIDNTGARAASWTNPPHFSSAGSSNYGSCVDVWAPGKDVASNLFSSATGTAIASGTSFAAPHVAALAARYGGPATTPIQRETYIRTRLFATGQMDGNPTAPRPIRVPTLLNPHHWQTTDSNGDGRSDLLYRNAATGQVYLIRMEGFAIKNEVAAYTEPNLSWQIVGNADFDGDRINDLLWRNTTTGDVYLQFYGAGGTPIAGAVIYSEPNQSWKIVQTPDLNGDSKADIVWWNSSTGQVALLMNGSTFNLVPGVWTAPNLSWRIVGSGDFLGSGKQNQLVWRNIATREIWFLTLDVTLSSLVSANTAAVTVASSTDWKIIAAADFNGDGKSDLLWRNHANGQVYAMLMNGAAIVSEGVVYTEANQAWRIVGAGDYNGDAKADILWRNETTGQVYLMLMNGLATLASQFIYGQANTAWKVLGPWEYGNANGIGAFD